MGRFTLAIPLDTWENKYLLITVKMYDARGGTIRVNQGGNAGDSAQPGGISSLTVFGCLLNMHTNNRFIPDALVHLYPDQIWYYA